MAPPSHRRPTKPDDEQVEQQAAAPAEATGAAALLAEVDVAEAERRRGAARMAARVPDDELADLPDLELLEEARRRGVTFTRAVTRSQIIAAAIAAVAE